MVSSALSNRNPNWPPQVHFERRLETSCAQRVRRARPACAQRRVHRLEVFNLVEKFPFGGAGQSSPRPLPLNQHLQEERKEIEIFLRRWEREGIDLEALGFQAHANIGAAK